VRRTLPFALHQLIEVVLGIALVALSIHVSHPQLLVVTGFVFVLLALCSDGRLGVFRLIPVRVHAWLDVVVAVAAAIAPVFPPLRPDITGIVAIELAALAWLRISTLTRYRPPAPLLTAASAPGDTVAPMETTSPRDTPSGIPVAEPAPPGGSSRDFDRRVNAGSRQLGRVAGSLTRTYSTRNQRRATAAGPAGASGATPGAGAESPGRVTDEAAHRTGTTGDEGGAGGASRASGTGEEGS
jgi:hypothetical protein